MDSVSRRQIVLELAKLAQLVEHEAACGFIIIATHAANESATVLAAPPGSKREADKLLAELHALHFRMCVIHYLGPKGPGSGATLVPPSGREDG